MRGVFLFLLLLVFTVWMGWQVARVIAFRDYKSARSPEVFLSARIKKQLPEPEASLLSGILLGNTANISKGLYQNLIKSGTLHIAALSGANIVVLITILAKFLFWLGRKKSAVIVLALIWFFNYLVGLTPSIVRATIMGSASLVQVFFGRQVNGLLVLFWTVVIMLVFDLKIIFDVSFQLSVLATLGIIFTSQKSNNWSLGKFTAIWEAT